jgi:MtrB/PioB family decaheme-associated outer membrane protein
MHRLIPIHLGLCFCLVAPLAARAQSAPASAPSPSPQAAAAPAASTAQPAQPAAAAPGSESSRSLFEPTWHEFFIGGRFTSIDGDPARYQRYQDERSGLLFNGFRYAFEQPEGNYTFHALADYIGYRDQQYRATYQQVGKLTLNGSWQGIPQFYSVDTKTAYTGGGGTLVLDDALQLAAQGSNNSLNGYVSASPQFDLRERRDVGRVDLVATPKSNLDVRASFVTQKHSGELPFGASFGFSNDVEVPLPYDSRTNDFTIGTEWTNARNMFRVAYSGSWFNNLAPTMTWDSPLDVTDAVDNPGRGRMTLWPSNSAQTISFGGYTKLAHKTQVTGFFSYANWSNNEPLQPFTINSALPQFALPRASTDASANVFSTNLNLVSHPVTDWRFGARYRRYDYNNEMPATTITDMISYDSKASTTPTGGPDLFAHSRTTFDADATYTKLVPFALGFGYTHNGNGYDARIFQSSGEDMLRLSADAVGPWATFRAAYEFGSRTGSGFDETVLTGIGEQPGMRQYDLADRTRNRVTGALDIVPSDAWTFSFSTGILKDDFSNSPYGLQDSTGRTFSIGTDYRLPSGFLLGGSYNYERYEGQQRSHEGDSSPAQFTDPLRDWTSDAKETVHYFSIFAAPPKIKEKTEVRLSYDFSHAEATNLYTIPAGSPITTPNQLPNVFNKLQQLHIDARHRLTQKLAASFSYVYEPLRIFDYAFDPSVVNSVAQPSSLVMGYVYRPYTANSFVAGLQVVW